MATILVLAGTGKTGRRVAARLAQTGHTARAAARHPGAPAANLEAVAFDWDDPESYGPALAGADAVYVVAPALRLDFAPLVERFLAQAKAAGVGRGVLLSARGVDQAPPETPLGQAEALLADSGLEWAIVRPTWFMQNFSEGIFVEGIARGELAAPAGDGLVGFVDAEDIAAVAAAALTEDGHAGQAYDLTGPELLTHADAARVIGQAAGRPVRYVDADPDAWEAGVREAGLPADYVASLAMLFGGIRQGWEARLADGVQRALGREPGSFGAFAEREGERWRHAVAA